MLEVSTGPYCYTKRIGAKITSQNNLKYYIRDTTSPYGQSI